EGRDGSLLRDVAEGEDEVPRPADRPFREGAEGAGPEGRAGKGRWRARGRRVRERTGRETAALGGGNREAAEAVPRTDDPGGAGPGGPVPEGPERPAPAARSARALLNGSAKRLARAAP